MSGIAPALLIFTIFLCGPIFTWSVIRSCDNFVDPQIAAMKIGALALAMAWFSAALARRAFPWRKSRVHPVVFLIVAWQAIGILWSPSRPLAVESLAWTLCGVATFLFAELFLANDESLVKALSLLLALAALQSALGIAQWFGMDFLPAHSRYYYADEKYLRVYGTFGNPNLLASYLCAMIPAGVWLTLRKRLTGLGVYCGVATCLMIVCVALTGARTAQFGALAGTMCLLFGMSHRFRRLIAASAAIVLCWFVYYNMFVSHPVIAKKESAITRSITWKSTILMSREHPVIGVGPGQFRYKYLDYQRKHFINNGGRDARYVNKEKPRNAHNDYLELLAESGVVGIVLMFMFVTMSLRGLTKTKSGAVSAAMLTALLCDMALGFPLHIPVTLMLFWLAAGISSGGWSESIATPDDKAFPDWASHPRVIAEMALVAFVVALILGNAALNPLIGRIFLSKARVAIAEERYADGQLLTRRAIQYDPTSGEAHFILGSLLMMQGKDGDALAQFRMSEKTTDDPRLHLNLALAHFHLNDYNAAHRELAIMSEMLPADTLPLRVRAGLLMKANQPRKALVYLLKAREIEPNNSDLNESIKKLRAYLQKRSEAAE